MQQINTSRRRGFTIVELLIVIVVIGILAAITIVAYNGIQARAQFATSQQELASIRKAILLFKAEKGTYPDSGDAWMGWDQGTNDNFIPGLVPAYMNKTPQLDSSRAAEDSYLYKSNKTDYQLIRYRSSTLGGLPTIERSNARSWFTSSTEAWGYWSSGVSSTNPSD